MSFSWGQSFWSFAIFLDLAEVGNKIYGFFADFLRIDPSFVRDMGWKVVVVDSSNLFFPLGGKKLLEGTNYQGIFCIDSGEFQMASSFGNDSV